MPESVKPDAREGGREAADPPPDAPDVEMELTRLEGALESLIDGLGTMRDRATVAEENHRKLAEALRDTDVDSMAPMELQARFEELAEENGCLRTAVDEARVRANRIRSRLMLMEDELSDG